MGAILDALRRLQVIELQISDINRGIARKAAQCKRQEQTIAELDAKIRAQQAAVRADQVEADRLELDVRAREADIAKLRQALNAAKTNKEYSALLTQLNTTKADSAKIEEKALAVLAQIDAKKKEVAALQEQRTAAAARLEELRTAAASFEQGTRERLAELRVERNEAAVGLPDKVVALFTRVAAKNEGQAMSLIVRSHPKREEYSCQGCNMAVTIEQVNAVMSRDEPVTCNNCGQILYLESPQAAASA